MKRTISTIMLLWSYYVSADCFDKAGRDYRIDPDLLRAIAWHESKHNTAAIGKNKDGTVDIGIMQINSRNFYHLEKFGITQYHIKNDPCMNIYTGAYYLSSAFTRWGYNWTSVGAYNAGFKKSDTQNKRRLAYAEKIYGIYKSIKLQKAINEAVSGVARRMDARQGGDSGLAPRAARQPDPEGRARERQRL